MSWLQRIAECNRHEPGRYLPLVIGPTCIGHIRRDRVRTLLDLGAGFTLRGGHIELPGDDFARRTECLREVVEGLAAGGAIRRPTGELYPLAPHPRAAPLALLERAAVAWFGAASCGVHLNGFVRTPRGIEMWIAERSHSKATHPGKLDNMVAGGQPHGLSLRANLIKECAEEAGIDAALASRASAVGVVSYVLEDDSGLKPDTLYCYDLELPDEFRPRCVDGEVERFVRMPIVDVASLVARTDRFKFNCNLVVIDFLLRHGLLDEEDPNLPTIASGLRTRLTPWLGTHDPS